jgi:uncharacterized membrane protein YfcA
MLRAEGPFRRPRLEHPAIDAFSPFVIVYACVVMVAAYAARGSTGFGAAAAMPLLGLVLPLKLLIPAWTFVGVAAGLALFGSDRRNIAWGEMAKLVPTLLIGIAAGLYIFTRLDSQTLAKSLGALVLIYGSYSLAGTFRPSLKVKLPPHPAAAVGGFLGGIVGTVIGTMGSVFFAIYYDAIGLAKQHFRATMTAVLLTLAVVRGIGYWAVGEFTREVMVLAAILFPMMLAGIFIGNRFHHGMNELVFRRTVSGALIASGLALLVK